MVNFVCQRCGHIVTDPTAGWICPFCHFLQDTLLKTKGGTNIPLVGNILDYKKLRTDLLPVSFLTQLAGVLGFGAKKYGDHNWKAGINYNRLYGATLRHLIAFWGGEDIDPESGLSHLAHAGCNIAFLTEFQAKKNKYGKFDNRQKESGNII